MVQQVRVRHDGLRVNYVKQTGRVVGEIEGEIHVGGAFQISELIVGEIEGEIHVGGAFFFNGD